jgi:hypothetical protein
MPLKNDIKAFRYCEGIFGFLLAGGILQNVRSSMKFFDIAFRLTLVMKKCEYAESVLTKFVQN